MSLLKTWKRRILRTFSKKNTTPGVLNKTWRTIATGIAGLGFLATTHCAIGQGVAYTDIIAHDLNGTTVLSDPGGDGNYNYHITSQAISGTNAFNSFSTFNLATNDTANFYLPVGTNNLINFVKSQIQIDGTINAIKDHKIGGNLFFLSAQGLILGSTGVVNCGAFYAMTPSSTFMDKFVGGSSLVISGNDAEIGQITARKFVNQNGVIAGDGIPLNSDGSIVISGRINAIDNVGASAGNVTLESGGRIDTGVTDFSALVNTSNIWKQTSDGSFFGQEIPIDVSVSALAMTTNTDGNVELVAVADNLGKSSSSSIESTGFSSFNKASADAKVVVKGTVNAKRNATFEATAVNGQLSSKETIVEYGVNKELKKFTSADSISSVKATVEIGSTARITADNDVYLKAFATNFYKSSKSPVDLGLTLAGIMSPVNIAADIAVAESKANVTVAQGSILTAKKNIDIKASSEADVIAGASTSLAKIKQNSGGLAAGVVYAEVSSEANIEIGGALNAGTTGDTLSGDIAINAVSNNALDATAAAKTGNDKAAIATGIVIGKVSNQSKIKINNTATVNAKKAVTGKSTNRSDVSTVAIVETGDDSYAGVAINFTDFNSSAKVDIASNITAANNIDLSAYNLVLQNRSTAKSTVGHSKISQAIANLQSSVVSGIFGLTKFTSKFTGPIKDAPTKFRAAGAIVFAQGSHDAGLNIGSDVKLASGNNLILKSSSVIEDIYIQADSVARSKMNTADGTKVSVSAGLVYADISQNSTVQIADATFASTPGNATALTGKTVEISSEAKIEYNRVKRMIQNIEDAVATLKIAVTDTTQLALITAVETAYQNIKSKFSTLGSEGMSTADNITYFIDALTSMSSMTNALSALISGESRIVSEAAKIVTSAADFAFYNNYLNTSVSSAIKGANEENVSDIGFAGAVALTDFKTKSDVLIGRNVTVQAVTPPTDVAEAIKISATANIDMIGAAGYLIPSSGSKAMGGTFFSQDFISSAKVLLAEGVNLLAGGKDVAITTTHDAKSVVGAFASAMAGSGIQGMFTYLTGTSDSSINIDNEVNFSSVKNIKLNALNNTRVINFAGSVMVSSGVGVAVGFAINDFVKDSVVFIGDIDDKYQDYLDEKTGADKSLTTNNRRTITNAKIAATGQVDAQAKSTGAFIAAGVAGGITKNDDSGESGIIDKVKGKADTAENKVTGAINSLSGKFSDITSELSKKTSVKGSGTHTNPSISISVAGSGGLNFIESNTKVDISGITLDLGGTAGSNLNAIAVNNSDVMAFAGSAGIMYQTAKKDTSGKSVGIAGAIGLNSVKNTTEAIIRNSTVNNADKLNVFAVNGGTNVAAGLGLQISKNSGNANGAFTMGGSVGINNIDNNVNAELNTTNVTGKDALNTNVNVAAYESDMQITGGVQVTVGQQKGAIGAAVNVANITNNISARINGGTFNKVKDIRVSALQALAQINGAVTAGIVTGTSNSVSIMGAMIYNQLTNNLSAGIKGANISASGDVTVNAQDYLLGETETGFSQILNRADSGVSSFISTDGDDYYDVDASNEVDGTLTTPLKDQVKKGTLIVSGAMAISTADTAVGAAVSINDINNKFVSRIDNSTVTSNAGTINTSAKSDTFIVSAAGGVAVSTKNGAGGGSVIWNDIETDVSAGTSNSVLSSKNVINQAGNDSRLIGISGQVSAGKGPAIGLAVTYNNILSNSNAFSLGTKVTGPGSTVIGSQFLVNATNNSDIIDIALAVPVSSNVGIGGAVAINRITNNTISLIDNKYTDDAGVEKTVSGVFANNFETVTAKAEDNSKIKSLAGGVVVGGSVAVGGAIAYNEVSGTTKASINNIQLGAKNVLIKSKNDADIWTSAAGIGGAGDVAVQGAAVTAEIARTISASLNNAQVNKTDSSIDIQADSTGDIISNATVVAIGGNVGVGAGVAVNRLGDNISASVTGGILTLKDLDIRSKAAQTVRTIGVAGAGGAYAGVSGSVAVNIIKTNNSAFIDGNAAVVAQDNIGVVAQTDDTLMNYSGMVTGGAAGVGAALSVNSIQGDTKAYIDNASVQAKGLAGGISVENAIADDKMNAGFISDESVNVTYTLAKQRTSAVKKGLVVDGSATHTLKSFVANAAGGGVALAGSTNVSAISGNTSAVISNTTINNGVTGGDINVNAADYTNLSGFVGSVGAAGSAGFGLSSDANKLNRNTSAKLDGIKSGSSAKDVTVSSQAKQGVSSIAAGIGIGGTNSVAGTVSVNVLSGNTEAIVNNSVITLNSLLVDAVHWGKAHILDATASVGGYAGVGGAIGINTNKDKVKAEVADSKITMKANGSGKFYVNARNETNLNTIGAAVSGGMVGLAGNVAINYIENEVLASVKNTTMVNRATDVLVKAEDAVTINSNLGTVAGGGIGAGASIGANILDGKVRAVVDGSKLYAVNSINITADQLRTINQKSFTLAGGVGAFAGNVMYVSSGNLLTQSTEDGAADVRNAFTAAESVNYGSIGETNNTLTTEEKAALNGTSSKLSSTESGKSATTASAGKFESTSGSTLDCSGAVKVKATENTTIECMGGSGAIGFVAAGGSVGIVNVNHNIGTSLANATINAGSGVDISSNITGTSNLEMYQGSLGYLGAGTAAYGKIGAAGNVFSSISDSFITANGNISIGAKDNSSANAESYGLTAGMIAAGALVTKIENQTSANVSLSGNTIITNPADGEVTVKAERENALTAKTVGGSLGLFVAGTGIASTVEDNGNSTVTSTGGSYKGKKKITLSATSKPMVVSEATSAAISGLVSAGVSVAKSNLSGKAELNVSGSNTFDAPEVLFNAKIYGNNKANSTGVSGGFAGSFGYNESSAVNNAVVNVLIGDSIFTNKATKLTLYGANIVQQEAVTKGLNVGGLIASGNNKAKAESNTSTKVELTGNSTTARELGSVSVTADSSSIHKVRADGNGGGLVSVDGLAAYAINKMTTFTQATISGKWKLSGILNLIAAQYDKSDINADSISAALIGYSGTKAENTINSTTKTSFIDNTEIESRADVIFQAKNAIDCNTDGAFSASGGGYGGIVVNGANGSANVTSTTEAKVGKNAKLTTSGDISGNALTDAVVYNKVHTAGAGMVANPLAHSTNTFSFSDKLVTNTGSVLKTVVKDKNVNLAASDNLIACLTSDSDMQGGLGGYSEAKTTVNATKNNTLDIYGDIFSANDVNLYTDADATGKKVSYTLTATADAYNKHSAVAIAKATLNSSTTQNNQINIYKGADINSIRHIGLNSTSGSLTMTEAASEYTWYSSNTTGGYTSTASGLRSKNLTSNNKVSINGNLISGINNKVDLTISGIVDLTGKITDSKTSPVITSTVTDYLNAVTTGLMDYGNELFTRYQEICSLSNEYIDTAAGAGYLAEKTRLLGEMEKYGLYDPISGAIIGGLFIQYVSLPDIVCSGGNIVINTDSVAGSGNINAKGAPEIIVTNNSNLYMKVNDLSIVDYGGELIYNSVSLGSTAKTKLPTLTTIQTSDSSSALISVNETWNGNLTYIEEGQTKTVTPVTNIEINGKLNNPNGKVVINNTSGDITLQGATAAAGASISAREIELKAATGAISQGFSDGILNIGGTPEDVYKTIATTQETAINGNESVSVNKQNTSNKIDETLQQGTWIAGNSVFLSAMDINVNGLIQSGYGEYKINLTTGAQTLISNFDSAYMGQNITPDMLTSYKLNTGGAKKDSTGKWYYEVQAYYNPQTKQIILEDINPNGGKVYLTGRISSTGNGKILAVDGSADIKIDNLTSKAITIGKVNVGNQAGLISITDLEKGLITEFRRDSTTTQTIGSNNRTVAGASTAYSPRSGLYYNWSTGKTVATLANYYKKIDFRLWGGYTKNETTISEYASSENLLSSTSDGQNKLAGTYIGTMNGATAEYIIDYKNLVGYSASYFDKWITYDNWMKSRGSEHYQWGSLIGKVVTFQHSLKASHDIGIGFIGSKTGGSVNLASNGNINLTGNVSGVAGTKVSINSTTGNIQQTGGKLIAEDLSLTAKNGIGSNGAIKHQVVGDQGKLNAVTTTGNISIVSNSEIGKLGNLELGKIIAGGDVNLTADGSLTRSSASDALVKGCRIDLTSNKGGIGKSGNALWIQGGQAPAVSGDTMSASVNATARDSIFLEQTTGDMRLGKIESTTGDVNLKVTNGSFDNVLPVTEVSDSRKGDDLVEKWIEMGLINADGTNNSAQAKAKAIASYESGVKAEFASYLSQKTYYAANPGVAKTAAYTALQAKYGSYSTANAFLTAKRSDSSSDYYKISNDIYGWSKNNLLYALQKSIINPTSGSTQTLVRPANVKGKNITLSAINGSIGKDGTAEELSIANLGNNLDTLKKLAAAEASDITWNEAGAKATIKRTTAIGIEMTNSSGGLDAVARDNIYIAAATNAPVYIKNINAGENSIRLLGKNGIYNVNTTPNAVNLKGKDLIIEGGANGTSSVIGTADRAVVTDLSGKLTARADGYINIFQNSLNPLLISALYGGGDVKLRSAKDLKSVNTGITFDDSGYLNAAGKLTLVSDSGNIGEDGKGIRLLSDSLDVVDANAGGSIYIKGQANSSSKPALNIGKVTTAAGGTLKIVNSDLGVNFSDAVSAQNIFVNALSVAQNEAKSYIKTGNLDIITSNGQSLDSVNNQITQAALSNSTSGNIELKNKTALKLMMATQFSTAAADKLIINNTSTLNFGGRIDAKNIDINAVSVAQDEANSSIRTDNLNVKTSAGLSLDSTNNKISQAALNNSKSGNIELKNNGKLKLLDVTNASTGATEKLVINNSENIDFAGTVSAKNIEIDAGSVSQNESTSNIKADNLKVVTKNGLSLDSANNLISKAELNNSRHGDIVLKNKTALQLNGVSASENLIIGNAGNITTSSMINTGRNITINVIGNLNSQSSIIAGNDLVVNATGNITAGTVQARSATLKSSVAASLLTLSLRGEQSDFSGSIVNQIAESGGINVHELLAREDVYGLSENGDIIMANIEGKRVILIVNHDDSKINVDQAKLGEEMNVTTNDFKAGLLEHSDSSDPLKLVFSGVNGKSMNDVTIDKVTSDAGVQIDNLNSRTARIFADSDLFWLKNVNLLDSGYFSNNQTSFTVAGKDTFTKVTGIKLTGSNADIAKQTNIETVKDKKETLIAGIMQRNIDGIVKDTDPDLANRILSGNSEEQIDYSAVNGKKDLSGKLVLRDNKVLLVDADSDEDENKEMETND